MFKGINLWSSPRNLSTALMYSFAQRKDTTVVDEPLFGHFLKTSGAQRPSRDEVLDSMETDGNAIIQQVLTKDYPTDFVFFKHIANHMIDLDKAFLSEMKNIILTRDPAAMINSFVRNVESPNYEDTAYGYQRELVKYFNEERIAFSVFDSEAIRSHPEKSLRRMCDSLEIPFDLAMLSWESGPIKEDGVWAKYWYDAIHKSTGFLKGTSEDVQVADEYKGLEEECRKDFDFLMSYAQ